MLTLARNEQRAFAGVAAALLLSVMLVPAESRADAYIGGSVGQAGVELDVPAVQPLAFDEDDFAWKAFLGYEWNLPLLSLGIEGGYVDFGAPSGDILGTIVEVDTDGLSAFGTLGVNLGPLGVFAKYWEPGRVKTRLAIWPRPMTRKSPGQSSTSRPPSRESAR